MICGPCREPHDPADCVDAVHDRVAAGERHCMCQHRPIGTATPPARTPEEDPEPADQDDEHG